MREYYYLFELEQSRFNLSYRDALYFAAARILSSYVYVSEEIYLTDPDDGIVSTHHSFYLRIPAESLRTVEKCMARKPHTAGVPQDALRKYELKEGFSDGRYHGVIPGIPIPEKWGPDEFRPFPSRISTPERKRFTFSIDELLFWTNDLEELVEEGLIQHRDSDTSCKHSPQPNIPITQDENSEIRRLQRTVAALALGLMKKYPVYKHSKEPNALRLAKLATEHLRDAGSDRTPPGFSETTVRQTIAAALKACPELKD